MRTFQWVKHQAADHCFVLCCVARALERTLLPTARVACVSAAQFQWAAHQAANQKFGNVVLRNYCAGDVVWVQDYHLMLLPAILKSRMPKMKVRLAPPGCPHWTCSLDLWIEPQAVAEQLHAIGTLAWKSHLFTVFACVSHSVCSCNTSALHIVCRCKGVIASTSHHHGP